MENDLAKRIAEIMHALDRQAAQALSERRFEDALTIYREILKAETELHLDKERGHTLMNMANTLIALNRSEEALDYLDEAGRIGEIAADPKDSAMLTMFRAGALTMTGRTTEAESILTKALRATRDNLIIGKLELMRYECYMKSGDRTKARVSIDKAVRCFELAHDTEELRRALLCRIAYFKSAGQGSFAVSDEIKLRGLGE